jgi:hypothetical protein
MQMHALMCFLQGKMRPHPDKSDPLVADVGLNNRRLAVGSWREDQRDGIKGIAALCAPVASSSEVPLSAGTLPAIGIKAVRSAFLMSVTFAQVLSRGLWRRLSLGLPTVLGMTSKGFFIPYRHHEGILRVRPPYAAVLDVLQRNEELFIKLLSTIDAFAGALLRINDEPPPAPRWTQEWFPRLDAAAAYAIVRLRRPARIVEVGAGHSTRFLARAVADGKLPTTITAIDPAPRARLDGLDVRLIKKTVERVGDGPFADLKGGDILSIDSSHVLMPGTDVDVLLNRILPSLPSGVLVHLHDIFLPDDYPEAWAWRGYNEQLGVAPLLLGGQWQVLWSSRYARSHLTAAVCRSVVNRLTLPPKAFESSLWLEKRPSHPASGGVADTPIHTDRPHREGHRRES